MSRLEPEYDENVITGDRKDWGISQRFHGIHDLPFSQPGALQASTTFVSQDTLQERTPANFHDTLTRETFCKHLVYYGVGSLSEWKA